MMHALDEILKEHSGVSQDILEEVRRIQQEKGGRLGELLVQKKALTEWEYLKALGRYYELPVWAELPGETVRTDYTDKVSIQFLKKYQMVPIYAPGGGTAIERQGDHGDAHRGPEESNGPRPVVAVSDPAYFQHIDDLCRILGDRDPEVVLAPHGVILSAINMAYDLSRGSAEQLVQDMEESTDSIISEIEGTADLLDDTSDAPIIKLVNHILSQAVKARASDIHIEPYQTRLKVRYRVDGILYDLIAPPKRIQSALVSRVKVMANMNIAEKRLPQDGRIEIRLGDKNVDIRVSTIPTTFGERVVLRLLDKTSSLFRLSDLGLSPDQRTIIDRLIRSPYGIILVTGPTGSGKTTTLYAVLSTINTPDVNIITIEDPVEYQIQGIGQIQVNPKIDLTFARGLRSIVRQDPDVILVGEIRDHETAEIAVQSSLTGHLVFSTLHTNDSASAITRLIDIGVEPFLISSSVLAVVAQRLVRVLCPACKEPFLPDEVSLAGIGLTLGAFSGNTLCRARGCPACLHTGYKGRVGIFEILLMESPIKSLILTTSDAHGIKEAAVKNGMVTLRQDGVQKVLDGITSIEEVFRVTQQ